VCCGSYSYCSPCLAARSRYESSAPAKPSITTSGPKSAGESALFSFFESGCWKSSWIVLWRVLLMRVD